MANSPQAECWIRRGSLLRERYTASRVQKLKMFHADKSRQLFERSKTHNRIYTRVNTAFCCADDSTAAKTRSTARPSSKFGWNGAPVSRAVRKSPSAAMK